MAFKMKPGRAAMEANRYGYYIKVKHFYHHKLIRFLYLYTSFALAINAINFVIIGSYPKSCWHVIAFY